MHRGIRTAKTIGPFPYRSKALAGAAAGSISCHCSRIDSLRGGRLTITLSKSAAVRNDSSAARPCDKASSHASSTRLPSTYTRCSVPNDSSRSVSAVQRPRYARAVHRREHAPLHTLQLDDPGAAQRDVVVVGRIGSARGEPHPAIVAVDGRGLDFGLNRRLVQSCASSTAPASPAVLAWRNTRVAPL